MSVSHIVTTLSIVDRRKLTSSQHPNNFPPTSYFIYHLHTLLERGTPMKMPRATRSVSTAASASASAPTSNPVTKLTPWTYRALKTEQGVFTTPPYSGDLKELWKFKDAPTAQTSAKALWERFQSYKYVPSSLSLKLHIPTSPLG